MLAADSDEAKRVLRSSRVRGVPSYVDGDGVVVPQIDVKEYSGKVILLERSDEVSSRFKRRGVRRMIELKEAATSAAELVRLGWRHEKGDVAVAVAYAPGDARRREICIGPKGETTEHVAVYESEIVLISVQAQDRASGASSFKAVGWIENMDEKGVSDTLFALQRGGASQLQHNAQVGVMICVGAKDKYGNAGHYVGDFNETIGMKIALQSARLCSVEMALLPAAALQRARRSKALERDRKKRGLGSSQLVEGFGDANPTTAEAMAYTRGYGVVMHSENGGCLEAIAWAGGQAAAEKLASPLVFALPDAGLLLDVGAAAAAAGRVALLSGDFVHGTLRVFDDEGEVVKHEVTATALLSKIHIQEPAPR
ncbi:hypothetical protein M885DRAFT_522121 [Pelagophyceae sp. CCMP2097]|nr:hypothetical protein M885DRAFT_522121 [Pelagophyceae sp. CCMP2097]